MKKRILLLFILLLTLVSCSNTKEEKDSLVNTVDLGENKMDYIKFGNGDTTFVMIPGLSVHSVMGLADSIKEAYASFEDEYTIYLFDRPKEVDENCTIKQLADLTASAMKELNLSSVYLFGASQGGMIAEYIAIDYPELVNKLILASTMSRNNETSLKVVGNWIKLAKEKNEEGLLEDFIEKVYSKETVDAYKDTLIESNKGITDEEYTKFINLAKSIETFDCYDSLDNIKCDVLVLGSNDDQVLTGKASEEIAEKLNCAIYMYDGYGHGVYDEAPDYKERIFNFYNK